MTYSTIIGLLLTAVGLILYILQEPDYTYKEFYIAALLGLGVGFLIGGIMGYAQKKRKKIIEPKFEPKANDTFKNKTIVEDDDSGLKL
ncbi:MAG: hypothetical protein ACR2MS_12600 [Weeksellaceae bacterium]